MPEPALKPRSAHLSWDEVHRLEVLMRIRASSLAKPAGLRDSCPICGDGLGSATMRLGGVLVHPNCLPSARWR